MVQHTHWITVIGRQRNGNSDDEQQFTAPCSYAVRGNDIYLSYTETDAQNHATRVTVKLSDKEVVMVRSCEDARTRMVFVPSQKNDCAYDTGSGILPLMIHTHAIEQQITDLGGQARLAYTLYYGGAPLSENEVILRLRKTEATGL